jgi:RNA polymerase sigma-70 factor, ECF subfamily
MTPLLAQRPRPDRGFERMYNRYVGDVYRYALAVMRNPADAEDITQTTFLNAYRAYVEKGSRPEKPQNWLIAIAHNVCRQRFRQSARRPTEVTFDDDIADSVTDDTAPTGEDIRRALGHLAFNQRAALVMRELEGRSYAEIAEILEVTPSAVETLIFRARRALREQLEGSLTCGEAEFAISRQLDGRLPRRERGQLRAHLRECSDCASFARRQRAQRGALKALALVPIPTSLTSLFGGGGAAVGTGIAIKAAAAVTAGLVIGGASYEGVRHTVWQAPKPAAAASKPQRFAVGASVAPDNGIVSPARHARGKPVAHARSGKAHVKKAHAAMGHAAQNDLQSADGHGRGNGHGQQTSATRGRAHVNVRHTPNRANSPSRAKPGKAKHEQKPKSNEGAQQQPPAREKAPPPGQSKDK